MNNSDELTDKLNILIKLTAMNMLKDAGYREKLRVLSAAGLSNKEMSEITGKSVNNVKVTLSLMKGGKKDGQQ